MKSKLWLSRTIYIGSFFALHVSVFGIKSCLNYPISNCLGNYKFSIFWRIKAQFLSYISRGDSGIRKTNTTNCSFNNIVS
uniref:Putative secreted protein n=1 Tax=Panstrongylus lignarius TaxID=156445 RepID=A0A224Y510_9HEMI